MAMNEKFIQELQQKEYYLGSNFGTLFQYITTDDIQTFTGQTLGEDESKYAKQIITTTCFRINDLTGNQIEDLPDGFNSLTDKQKDYVRYASCFLAAHYFSGAFN